MEKLPNDPTVIPQGLSGKASAALGRRMFMRYIGATAAAGVALSACHSEMVDPTATGSARAGFTTVDLGDLGSNDIGILNYAYALEQLEAAFYTQAVATPYAGMTAAEKTILSDIRDHEIAHREFFKTALGSNAIPALEVNFSSINFASRDSVLATAKAFEDLGVSAYNGAGKLLTSPANLLIAGKIVSVEARHAATIRDLISNGTFASNDVVDATSGLDKARMPSEVLSIAGAYLKSKLNASNLPTS